MREPEIRLAPETEEEEKLEPALEKKAAGL
ncbi:hypothetical protein SDC9_186399 [bioreactor metagenome]|uniref:Uncharacterized protein n=1 Tax=bioreactor metagenome TaxID=1076179 RepID=A0A645HRW1_9ZZZZ